MPSLALPPTSAYPSDPTALERERLDALYLELKGNDKSLMISRDIHRSRSEKQGGQLRELSQRLRALAAREASVKAEAYAMLEIVTDVVEHLEDAGDEMGNAFGAGEGAEGPLQRAGLQWLHRPHQGSPDSAAPGGETPLAAKAPAKPVVMPSGLSATEARLDHMEVLLQRIAERVG